MGMFGPPGYPPAPPAVAPLAPGNYDPCILCSMAQDALLLLMGGKAVARIHFKGRETGYQVGNVRELRAEVRRLEQECELSRGMGRAVQAGPPPVPNGWGLGWPFGFNPFGPRRF